MSSSRSPASTDSVGASQLGRREFLAFLSMVMALAAVGIDVMLPAFDEMRVEFGLAPDSNELARVVTAYLLGLAVAPLIYGSLADRFGRRPVLLLGGVIYVIGAVASALAPTLSVLLAARFVWGLGAAAGRVVVLAVIRDTQRGDEMARTMSYIMAVFVLVPVIGPSLGALVVALGPWQSVFWLGGVAGLAVLAWSSRLGETLSEKNRQPISFTTIKTTAVRLMGSRKTLAPLLGMIGVRAVMASYLASSQLIIADIFDRDAQFPYIFGVVAIALGAGSLLNGRLLRRSSIEQLLPPIAIGYLLAGLATLAVALLTQGRPNFWLFMPILTIALSFQMLLTPNLNTLILEPMGDVAGTASALAATVSSIGGALLGAMVDARIRGSVTPLTVGVALSAVAMLSLLIWARPRAATHAA